MSCAKIRFCNNNIAANLGLDNIEYSSEQTAFPFTNSMTQKRFQVWKPEGNFEITEDNQNIYITDFGGEATAVIPVGKYTSATLAVEMKLRLDIIASSTSTVNWDSSTRKWTISFLGNTTLRLSNQEKAIWKSIGFTTTTDQNGLSHTGNATSNHTSEYVSWDFKSQVSGNFFALISHQGQKLTISDAATITLKGSNVNDFTQPGTFEAVLERSDYGIFAFNDLSGVDALYRYWKFEFTDNGNTVGPKGFSIGNIYLGDYDTLTSTNLTQGFIKTMVDLSKVSTAESGAKYFRLKSKLWQFSSMQVQNMSNSDRLTMEDFFEDLGIAESFYFSLDPGQGISASLHEGTKYMRFTTSPSYSHLIRDIYTMSFALEEVI